MFDVLISFEFLQNYVVEFGPFFFLELVVLLNIRITKRVFALLEAEVFPIPGIQVSDHQ
jgi:hypothetical protein